MVGVDKISKNIDFFVHWNAFFLKETTRKRVKTTLISNLFYLKSKFLWKIEFLVATKLRIKPSNEKFRSTWKVCKKKWLKKFFNFLVDRLDEFENLLFRQKIILFWKNFFSLVGKIWYRKYHRNVQLRQNQETWGKIAAKNAFPKILANIWLTFIQIQGFQSKLEVVLETGKTFFCLKWAGDVFERKKKLPFPFFSLY